MVAGEVSQLSLISLEGSCVAKTQQLPSSWLRLWEPEQKAEMHHYKPVHGLSLSPASLSLPLSVSYFLSCSPFPPSLSLSLSQKHSEITPNCTRFLTFTPWLNYNLRFCSRPSSSFYSVMWFRIPTLQRTACGVGCMFRFLQINSVCLPSLFAVTDWINLM